MTLLERVSYIRGLMEGRGIEDKDPMGKVVSEIVDVLDEMAASIEDMDDYMTELDEYVGEIDEDLEAVEDFLDDECDCDCDEDDFYSVVCPNCGEEFCVDNETADKGELNCPNCGEELEFDLSDCENCPHDCGSDE